MIQTIEHGPIRELRLARPPANALSPELIAALRDAVLASGEGGARAIVLSGAPGRFSGGLDVPHLLTLDRAAIAATWRDFYGMMRALAASPVPIAAALTGHSPAGGAVISLFCDYRVMAEGDYRIGLNEVQVGLPIPPVIHTALRRVVGDRLAERLVVTGALIPAAEAARIGLVDELAPLEQVVERAVEWCRSVLTLPPGAVAETRRIARASLIQSFDEAGEAEVQKVLNDWFSPETQGAMQALVERLAKKKG